MDAPYPPALADGHGTISYYHDMYLKVSVIPKKISMLAIGSLFSNRLT